MKVLTLVAKFKRKDAEEYFLAWTTTPWTLAANVALTVGTDIDYVKVKMTAGDEKGKIFYVAEILADKVLGEGNYEIRSMYIFLNGMIWKEGPLAFFWWVSRARAERRRGRRATGPPARGR